MISIKIKEQYAIEGALIPLIIFLQTKVKDYTSLEITIKDWDMDLDLFKEFYSPQQINNIKQTKIIKIRSKIKRSLIVSEQNSLRLIIESSYEQELYKFLGASLNYTKENLVDFLLFEGKEIEEEFCFCQDFDTVEDIELI